MPQRRHLLSLLPGLLLAGCQPKPDADTSPGDVDTAPVVDGDGDGWGTGDDCDDADAAINPGMVETCNGVDDDCNDAIDEVGDLDGDGENATACMSGTDCDDGDPTIHAGAEETCDDGIDQDCNGVDARCGYSGYSGSVQVGADAKFFGIGTDCDAGRMLDTFDLTGDGVEDLIIPTLYANSNAGGAYVVPGATTGLGGSHGLSTAGFHISGTYPETFGAGRAVGGADVNGDGFGDLLIGSPWYDEAPTTWITFGPITADADVMSADVALVGEFYTWAGHGADISDFTGDGIGDAVVGAYMDHGEGFYAGTAYIVNGPLSAGRRTLESSWDAKIDATGTHSHFGRFLRAGGDVSGDGIGDFLIAAPEDNTSAALAGSVYVFHGPVTGSITTANADGSWYGERPNSTLGTSGVGFGDIDGDGVSDALMGADPDDAETGAAYVAFGPASGVHSVDAAGIILRGTRAGMHFGSDVAGGDTDGAGADDLLVGAHFAVGGYGDTGAAYLFTDLTSGSYTADDADAAFWGETSGDFLGFGVALGDLDGDNHDEVILGAPYQDTGGRSGGAVYVQWP